MNEDDKKTAEDCIGWFARFPIQDEPEPTDKEGEDEPRCNAMMLYAAQACRKRPIDIDADTA